MGALTAAGCGVLVTAGVLLVVTGARRSAPPSPRQPSEGGGLARRWSRIGRRMRLWVGLVSGLGLATAVLSGWPVLALVVPAIGIGVPFALSAPHDDEVADLAAIDRWLRLLGPSIGTGKSVRDAILSTARQAPERLQVPLQRLTQRIDLGWNTRDALLAMADELGSPDTDAPLAALAMASDRGGTGSRALLEALTDNTRARLRDARTMATERAKPLTVVRQVVAITTVILAGMALFSPGYFAPYSTPLGQALALGVTTLYVGSLVLLRHRMRPSRGPRFLGGRT
ncbi:MAG: type II secretion system F family protein [Arachnia propionica]|uniref:type II secretion system F family protein n=1 Tax=Arachnia propionica TaxID=1750 RepID=UPI0026F70A5B|nr:type II secretion system F family protein [Arachnia propionica]